MARSSDPFDRLSIYFLLYSQSSKAIYNYMKLVIVYLVECYSEAFLTCAYVLKIMVKGKGFFI